MSLLLQTDFEGRAEIGFAEDDNLHVKVNDLFDTWIDALMLDRSTGWLGINEQSPAQPVHIGGTNPCLRLQESPDGHFDLMNTQAAQSVINRTSAISSALIDINPDPQDGVSNALLHFFRATDTTGSVRIDIHAGNGTSDANCRLSGNGASFVNALQGAFGVGTDAPQVMLDVNGPVRVGRAQCGRLAVTFAGGTAYLSSQ